MAIFITFDKRNGYFYQKIGIKAGISPFCMSISISIGIKTSDLYNISIVSVSTIQTWKVSVSYQYRKKWYRRPLSLSGSGWRIAPVEFLLPPPCLKEMSLFCQSRHLQSRAYCPANSKYVNLWYLLRVRRLFFVKTLSKLRNRKAQVTL